jgi:hypothetical protein
LDKQKLEKLSISFEQTHNHKISHSPKLTQLLEATRVCPQIIKLGSEVNLVSSNPLSKTELAQQLTNKKLFSWILDNLHIMSPLDLQLSCKIASIAIGFHLAPSDSSNQILPLYKHVKKLWTTQVAKFGQHTKEV